MVVNTREELPEKEPLAVPKLVTVHASTECFTTPGPVIDLMIDYADIQDGQHILEPSAGIGLTSWARRFKIYRRTALRIVEPVLILN